jgi:hypothetical protein
MADNEWNDLRYGLAVATAPRVRAFTDFRGEALRKYRPLHEGEQPLDARERFVTPDSGARTAPPIVAAIA